MSTPTPMLETNPLESSIVAVDRYCVMGHPVAHSRSPWIHSHFAALTGQVLRYERCEVPLDGLGLAVRSFVQAGGRGCNVTVPFKLQAAALADHRSDRVVLAQAANTLSFEGLYTLADNTDGVGLIRDIQNNLGWSLRGQRILLVGAGGAAAGVLGSLLETRPAHITITNRTFAKASELVLRHLSWAALQKTELKALHLQALDSKYDVIINATSSSLQGVEFPLETDVLVPGGLAYDMMYGAATDGFAAWAQRGGAVFSDGLGMLVEQAAEAFWIWRGIRPPSAQVLAELRHGIQS